MATIQHSQEATNKALKSYAEDESELARHHDELFDLFHYHFRINRRTGKLRWQVPTTSRVRAGDPAGYRRAGRTDLYLVGFYSEVYKVHRVVTFMLTGNWPMTGRDRPDNLIGETPRRNR
jgi:hypothetical protein